MVKQLKNRYNDPTMNKRFVVGIDRAKMRLYDCEQSAQADILDSGQDEEYTPQEKTSGPRKSFEGFKFDEIKKKMSSLMVNLNLLISHKTFFLREVSQESKSFRF